MMDILTLSLGTTERGSNNILLAIITEDTSSTDDVMRRMGSKPPTYERRAQIKHFFDDKQSGQTRRTWLELQLQPPDRSTEGWVNDGKIRLTIGEDKDVKGSFLLSIPEAARVAKVLEMIVEDHEVELANLWRE